MAEKEIKNLGSPAETSWGYAQGVRVGDTVYLSGQTGGNADGTFANLETQMRNAYAKIAKVLAMYNANMDNVVEEIIYRRADITDWRVVAAKVRKEIYGGVPQVAATVVQIPAIGSGDRLIEIQCTAKL